MKLEARIAWKEPFYVVGEKIRYTPEHHTPNSKNEISKLWQRFNPRGEEILHFDGKSYGMCIFGPEDMPGQAFDYIAGAGVAAIENIPEGMVAESFAGGLYCVIQRRGPIDEIGEAFQYYDSTWLPNSDYEPAGGVHFELYDDRYKGNDNPDSVMELWFSIRRKHELPIENRAASLFVHVTDLRRATEWYCKLLGLPIMEERMNGGPVYWFDLPGTGLVLDSDANNRNNPDWQQEKPLVMLAASDIDRAYAYIGRKAQVLSEPHRFEGMAYFNFYDPEGNAVMACWSADGGKEYELPVTDSPVKANIGGVFVNVKDMEKAASWYSDLLGVPLNEEAVKQSVYSVPVTRGASLLLDDNRYSNHEAFEILFMFDTDDIHAAYDFAADRGMTFHGELERHGEISFFVLKDPDGNLIMVCQGR